MLPDFSYFCQYFLFVSLCYIETSQTKSFIAYWRKKPTCCREAVEQYRQDINPARAFLLYSYDSDDGSPLLRGQACPCEGRGMMDDGRDGITCEEIYQTYVQWCLDNGYKPLNSNNFGKEVKRAFPDVQKERVSKDIKRVFIYSGLNIREGSEINESRFCSEIDSRFI